MKLRAMHLMKLTAYSSVMAFSLGVTPALAQLDDEADLVEDDAGLLGDPAVAVDADPAVDLGGLYDSPEELEDQEVFTLAGEAVGEVDEVMRGSDGQYYLVVEHGGFLEIEEEEFIVPLASADITAEGVILSEFMLGDVGIETGVLEEDEGLFGEEEEFGVTEEEGLFEDQTDLFENEGILEDEAGLIEEEDPVGE